MKKIISAVLAAVLVLSFSVNTFAENPIIKDGGSDTVNLKGTFVAAPPPEEVISVNIGWGSMEFKYTGESEGEWDPVKQQYVNKKPAGWSCEEDFSNPKNRIYIQNKSNVLIDVNAQYSPAAGFEEIKVGFNDKTTQEKTYTYSNTVGTPAVEGSGDNWLNIFANPEGVLSQSTPASTAIGTITVTIAKSTK